MLRGRMQVPPMPDCGSHQQRADQKRDDALFMFG